jgi:hypothetical protein
LLNEFYDKYAERMGFDPEYVKGLDYSNSAVMEEMRSNIIGNNKH